MFQLIKTVIGFLWRQKKLLIFISFLTVLFFSFRFPWNALLEKTVKNLQKKSPSGFQTDFDELDFKFFPPGVKFSDLSLRYKRKTLLLDQVNISLLVRKWLAFKRAWRIQMVKGHSSFYVDFWKKKKLSKDNPDVPVTIYFLKAFSPSLDLEAVRELLPNVKTSGKIKIQFDYEGFPAKIKESKASLILEGEKVQLSQTELKTHLGSLNLPPIIWKEGEISAFLKEGELAFKTFRLGSPSDKFVIQFKGSAALKYAYGSVRVESYDLKAQIDVDKKVPMKLLDLMFAGYKEDKGSFFRYRMRLTGTGKKVPDMEKISEF